MVESSQLIVIEVGQDAATTLLLFRFFHFLRGWSLEVQYWSYRWRHPPTVQVEQAQDASSEPVTKRRRLPPSFLQALEAIRLVGEWIDQRRQSESRVNQCFQTNFPEQHSLMFIDGAILFFGWVNAMYSTQKFWFNQSSKIQNMFPKGLNDCILLGHVSCDCRDANIHHIAIVFPSCCLKSSTSDCIPR